MVLSIERIGRIGLVTIDNPPVNALSRAVRSALLDAAEALDADAEVDCVVLTCAGRTFVAGADVTEFDLPPAEPHLPDVLARIECAEKPWVAAIHGSALGGGLELALACRFRLASPTASFGLPEVTIGLIPGAGGTVRLPRLVPVAEAVALATTGKPIPATKAVEIGLVDTLIEGELQEGAAAFLAERLQLPAPLSERAPNAVPPGFWDEVETRVTKSARGETAPPAALASLRLAVEVDFEEAMAFERETFLKLRNSLEADALRYVTFAERAAARPAVLKQAEPMTIRTAGVVGGGTMGAGIAAALRDAGIEVILIERDEAALERGLDNIRSIFEGQAERGRLAPEAASERIAGVSGSTDFASLSDVDLAVEAVFEDLTVKRAVFAALDAATRPDAILATNTSYLDPRLIAEPVADASRFVGLHFFSPAHVMRLLEIVPLPETSARTLATSFALGARLKKISVQAGICDGFIGNRILKRYRAAAEDLLRRGCGVAEVDAAMRAFGFAMGPFEAQDMGGLDIAFLQREGARARGEPVADALADLLVRAGRNGRKTGGGWYDYRPGDRQPHPSAGVAALIAPHIHAETFPSDIAAHLVAEMAREGAAILTEGIAGRPEDVDLVEVHGYGFPRRKGGPLFLSARTAA
ncbi:3-hydroxyacyl-CoA dehydrogenase [Aureimonas ureilytica]|uniref:3-hydroxyacyl-CoA dehydrogenase n=1 Tax=Aureimonas ureilytica TaxID=401562 RepID=A0A175R9R7_9HYPH|nr:3-hydroxyacyl-CoA dehydrogenase NAD-binding domain-containing protein [Aureimonas ureilytica]KTQ96315.1 3-hydroxyacyl-CoA dehydrogenase [Aureimonas ureilytica]